MIDGQTHTHTHTQATTIPEGQNWPRVKKGGILSLKLFNRYVDVLSQQLNKVMVGCCMNGKVINHLYYADDLVLFSPSTHGIQMLLNERETYAFE